ncbi:MAG: hypothetical protein R3C20_25460 [Planctomycetaceae bacterium]
MKTTKRLSNFFRNRSRRTRRQQTHFRLPALERLESRELLAAAMGWEGDILQITGSEGQDFIAVQQDELGTRVFTEDAVFTEYEGRSLDSAASIVVSGRGGNDILFSYQTDLPVSLSGDDGNDFLYSNAANDVLDGGPGLNWIQTEDARVTSDDAFGISGLDLIITPEFNADGRIGLHVDAFGDFNIAGHAVAVSGDATVTADGVAVEVTGAVANWDDAFDIEGLDLGSTSLTLRAGTDVNDGDGYRVDVQSQLNLTGADINIRGSVDVRQELTTAAFVGTVADWDDAFGVDGLHLTDSQTSITAHTDHQGDFGFEIDVLGALHVEDTAIDVSGRVNMAPDQIDAVFSGSIASWDDAFGIEGLDLKDSEVNVVTFSDRDEHSELRIDLSAEMLVDDVEIDVSGSVQVTPEMIDAVFDGSVADWNDAFGIAGLDLLDSELAIAAFSDRQNINDLQIDLNGDLNIHGTKARVEGSLDIDPERVEGILTGTVAANWANAFGITGLTLADTQLRVNALHDRNNGNRLSFDLAANMDVSGIDVAVTGEVELNESSVSGSLTGVIAGTWSNAFGIAPLHLHDTTINVSGTSTSAGSNLSVGVSAGMNVLGMDLGVSGIVEVTPDEVRTTLTGLVSGEWMDAFGIPGLDLRNTALTIDGDSASTGLDIDLDTDLKLFGSYVDMIGELDLGPAGVDVSFSPPGSLAFTNLLGIDGFTLDDADLTVTAGLDGLEVAISSSIDMGNLDVDLEGVFLVSRTGVRADLTGRVAEWDNAFEVPGLNLNDVVLTLGAESGDHGASMFIGVGAGIEIGRSELQIAGLVGFGSTGWEVAFRGSIDSLTGDDLIDFANTMNQAADPNAAAIPDGSLGDFELRAAYINFAPHGGNAELGIEDGFGIGAAFYNDGKLIGSGEFIVDLANGVFEAGLQVPEMHLGPVELNDVSVDIRLAPTNSWYRVAGQAQLMGANVALDGTISSNSFSLQGSAAVDLAGLSASVQFIVDQNGVRFVATSGGGAINAVKDSLTSGIRAVANTAQAAIDTAQAGVDLAKKGVANLEADLAEARAEAQKTVDKIKADINSAKSVVDSALASRNYWGNQKSVRYTAWRKAVSATNDAKWYDKPYYKAIEISRYSSYVYSVGRYSTQVVVYNAAKVTYNAIREAAGWALDAAGVEASPNVVRLKALLAAANLAVDTAEMVLDGVERANAGVLQALNTIDSVRVTRITIAGNVSDFRNSGLKVTLDYSVGDQTRQLSLDASADNLVEQLGKELLAAIV